MDVGDPSTRANSFVFGVQWGKKTKDLPWRKQGLKTPKAEITRNANCSSLKIKGKARLKKE
jgi:hypothetical protein